MVTDDMDHPSGAKYGVASGSKSSTMGPRKPDVAWKPTRFGVDIPNLDQPGSSKTSTLETAGQRKAGVVAWKPIKFGVDPQNSDRPGNKSQLICLKFRFVGMFACHDVAFPIG